MPPPSTGSARYWSSTTRSPPIRPGPTPSRSWRGWPAGSWSSTNPDPSVASIPRDGFEGVWYPPANPGGLSELEVAAGLVVGQGGGPPFAPDHSVPPIAALRDLGATVLATPPCVVAFSGGRDSSALLALLVDVARVEGLDQPIAVTARGAEDEAYD